MNQARIMLIALGALAAAMLVAIPVALVRRASAARRLRHHASKAVEALKDLTSEQRDEAVEQAKATIEGLDEKIADLRKSLYGRWAGMDEAARDRTRGLLDALSRERNQVSQWYGAMMQSPAQTWKEVKGAFMKSFTDLSVSLERAWEELSS